MMPSIQSRFFRLVIKYTMGAQLKRAGDSVDACRKIAEQYTRNLKIPEGTEVQPLILHSADAESVGAEWVCAPGARVDRAALHLHGGGFISGSMDTHRELAARLSASTRARFLVIDYRLAPEHPFPAALKDARMAYHWLLDEGYTPEQLVVVGDSAGGGLALQTLLALREEGSQLPAAALFMSPFTEFVRYDGESYETRARLDPMLSLEVNKIGGGYYVGENDPLTPLLNPLDMDLAGLPPMCIHVGDCEVLLSDSTRLAERARAAGVEVAFKVWPGMWHDFQTVARYVPEARQSIDELGKFILGRMAS
jgi:acetyl esterase/lipase